MTWDAAEVTGGVLPGAARRGAGTGRGAARARHRRSRSLFPQGRHRARISVLGRWGVPLGVAVVIVAVVALLLVLTDVATAAVTPGAR